MKVRQNNNLNLSAFIIEQRKENEQLHYKLIELQDKLSISEKVIGDE